MTINTNTLRKNNNTKIINNQTTTTTKPASIPFGSLIKKQIAHQKTRIKNLSVYNESLVDRGRFLERARIAIAEANQKKRQLGKRGVGRPKLHQDAVIKLAFAYREIFKMTLRQTEGFIEDALSIFCMKAPKRSTLQRRMQDLELNLTIDRRRIQSGIVLVDSTGYKISGEGEWKVRKHGQDKRRSWAKVHYLVDWDSMQILAVTVTADNVGDNLELPKLIKLVPEEIEIKQVFGDGAYDTRAIYRCLEEQGIIHTAPPPKNTKLYQGDELTSNGGVKGRPGWKNRNRFVKRCKEVGKAK